MADDQPGGQPPAQDTSDSIDARFTRIEDEQRDQRGILTEIRDHLTGAGSGDAGGSVTQASDPAPAGDMAEQMRQAVRDVNAERDHDAEHAKLRQPPPETSPREIVVRGKEKLQNVLFGGDRK